jgi:SOS response regulatory protein OraA/RecX
MAWHGMANNTQYSNSKFQTKLQILITKLQKLFWTFKFVHWILVWNLEFVIWNLFDYIIDMEKIYNQIWESALRKLRIRPHSNYELERKLTSEFPDERGIILKAIEEMERVNLLNDRRFTEEYIHHLIQKPIGRIKITVEARKKGLDHDLVEQMLLNEEWSEEDAAKKAIEEKGRTLRETDERSRKHKMVNFLRSRGFRDAVIYKAVR